MINLIPPDIKQEIIFGRKNIRLLRWITALLITIGGVALLSIFGQFYITKNIRNQQASADISAARLDQANYASTTKELQTLSNNVKTIVQLLSKQLLFSKMLTAIGGILPNGTALSDITLSSSDSAIDLSVAAASKDAATQAFVNINDTSNNFFAKADLVSITCDDNNTDKKYPCSALIRVVLKKDSSFYFLNSVTSGSKQ